MLYGVYNAVPFRVLKVQGYAKYLTTTDDGAQPVMVHTDFTGTIMVNPAHLNRSDFDNPVNEPVLEGPAAAPPVGNLSVPEILLLVEARFAVPRRPFLLWAYYQRGGVQRAVYVRSPQLAPDGQTYLPCDARHGPTPKVTWSDFEYGQGSVVLGVNISTDLPVCPYRQGGSAGLTLGPAMLANRWSTTIQSDPEHALVSHVIRGEAIFNLGVLKHTKATPDMFSGRFLHPVPLGFQRKTLPEVTLRKGGDAVDYVIVDEEQPADKPGIQAFGAWDIDVVHQREYTKSNLANLLSR